MLRDMSPPYLPVITTIVGPDAATLTPAEELHFVGPTDFVLTAVTGDGPDRVEVRLYHPPDADTLPFTIPVVQPAVPSGLSGTGVTTRTILAFASTGAASRVTGASMVASAALSQDPTDFATFSLWECDAMGAHFGAALYTGTTQTGGTNATGDWVGGEVAVDVGLGVDIASDHTLVVEWNTNHGGGALIPGGWWRIT